MVNGDRNRDKGPCLGSGSDGELGGLGPMVNLALDFGAVLYLFPEVGSGEGVLDDLELVRRDSGCKNGGENDGSPPCFWGLLSAELRRGFKRVRFGCDCECLRGFRWDDIVDPVGGVPVGFSPEAWASGRDDGPLNEVG